MRSSSSRRCSTASRRNLAERPVRDRGPDHRRSVARSDVRPRRRLRPAEPEANITVLYNPKNQGYGGNQKIGYHYAIDKGFDAVVLLHGDGQYAPEHLPAMLAPLLDGTADVVLGSRMINRADALRGKMPLYKWVGNQILTFCQNRILGSQTGRVPHRLPRLPGQRAGLDPVRAQLELLRLRYRNPDPVDGHRQALPGNSGADVLRRRSVARERAEIRGADRPDVDPVADHEARGSSTIRGSTTRSPTRTTRRSSATRARTSTRLIASARIHRARHRLRPRVHAEGTGEEGRENDFARPLHRRVDARQFAQGDRDRHRRRSISRTRAGSNHSAARRHRTSGLARTVPAAREGPLLRGCAGDGDHDGQHRLPADPPGPALRTVQLWQARRPRSDAYAVVHVLVAAPPARAERLRRGRGVRTSRALSAGAGEWLARPRPPRVSTAC